MLNSNSFGHVLAHCFLIVSFGILLDQACSGQQIPGTSGEPFYCTLDSIAPTKYQPIFVDGKSDPEIRGVWKVRGYGFVLQIQEQGFRWYSKTKNLTWEHTPDEPVDFQFAIEASSGRCYVKPYPTESAYIMERLDSLPARFSAETKHDAAVIFQMIEQSMTEYYPFFESRNHNWQARVASAQNNISSQTSDAELFEVLQKLFEGLNDGHTSLEAEVDGEAQQIRTGMSSLRRAIMEAFESQNEQKDFRAYFRPWWQAFVENMKTELLGGNSKSAYDDTLIWGRVSDDVGYLFVRNMANYFDEDMIKGLYDLHLQLELVFDELGDCDSIIIDVSVNSGGYHSIALAFASHLADQRRYALAKYPIGAPDLLQKFDVFPYRNANGDTKTYTKPVYVVVTDATVSAGEEFVLAARAFPHVQIVGTRTNGMLSDVLTKPLPNGWLLNMSNEIFLDHQGVCYEAVGIPATLQRPIFDYENVMIDVGHCRAIRKLAEEISARSN